MTLIDHQTIYMKRPLLRAFFVRMISSLGSYLGGNFDFNINIFGLFRRPYYIISYCLYPFCVSAEDPEIVDSQVFGRSDENNRKTVRR